MEEGNDQPTPADDAGVAVWLWTIAILVIIAIGVLIVAVNKPEPTEAPALLNTESST